MEKNKNTVIALLVVLFIILAVLCVLFATGTISLKEKAVATGTDANNSVLYTTENISGAYKYVSEEMTDDYGNKITASYTLKLYSNGLFEYRMSTLAPFGYIGNYTIDENRITLNYLFGTTSGYGINVLDKSQTKEIVIDANGNLIDAHQSIKNLSFDTVNLTKDTSKEITEDEILNKLYETAIFNKVTND